jgi:hypothetical protein
VSRLDKIVLFAGCGTVATLGVVAVVLHLRFGEVMFFNRVIAGIAGCL